MIKARSAAAKIKAEQSKSAKAAKASTTKPGSAKKGSSKKTRTSAVGDTAKKVYSRAYHQTEKKCLQSGMSSDSAKDTSSDVKHICVL